MTMQAVSHVLGIKIVSPPRYGTYRLCDIVDDYSTVRIPVVHGRQGLVAFLSSSVPDLELDCCVLVERDCLCEEGGADGGFSVGIELVLAVC
jgi:hypothetical protein